MFNISSFIEVEIVPNTAKVTGTNLFGIRSAYRYQTTFEVKYRVSVPTYLWNTDPTYV